MRLIAELIGIGVLAVVAFYGFNYVWDRWTRHDLKKKDEDQ